MAVVEDEVSPVGDPAVWLVAERALLDRGEARWLEVLGRFDAEAGWVADGALSAVAWLVWRTGMSRPTAYEKVRVARQLHRRSGVAAAFRAGEISYSAVRAITRVEPDDLVAAAGIDDVAGIDAALVDLARSGTVAEVERAVRHVQLLVDQERRPVDPDRVRRLRVRRHGDGTATIEVTLPELEVDEFVAALSAFVDLSGRRQRSEDSSAAYVGDGESAGPVGSGEEAAAPAVSSAEDDGAGVMAGRAGVAGDSSAEEFRGWAAVRVDAFVDLVRTALAGAGDGHAMGADRYLVHLVDLDGILTRLDGTPLGAGEAGVVACDASTVRHCAFDQGRKERVWSTAQRRRILVRDGGTCRFPGCDRRIVDVHHLRPWSEGGPTDVANGLLVCRRHHRRLHDGYTAAGHAEATLTFARPDGTAIGTTTAWTHTVSRMDGAGASIVR